MHLCGANTATTRNDYNLPRGNCFATAHTSRTINGGAAPQAADLSVVVGAVGAGVMMQAMMLWLLVHYQRILGLRNAWLLRQEMDVLMKLVTAIIRPFKLDEPRRSHQNWRSGADRHRSTGLRASKGPHGNLSRCGIRRALATEDQGRDRLPIQSSGQDHQDNHLVRENRKDWRRQDFSVRPRPCGAYSHQRNRR